MQVTCEKCSAKYNIGDDKIKASGTAVRCPKCQHVFKVFPAASPAENMVACADCGKSTPSVAGQSVAFCQECQAKLAGGGQAADDDPFAGANLFGDAVPPPAGGLFDDEPAAAPPAPPATGGLFDDTPADPGSGGGLFDDAPQAPASGGGLFDDAPAASSGGGLFDDEPAAPSGGGGLFDDEPAPSSGGGLFDDEPAAPSSGGGLFDEPSASSGSAADPFGDFDEPAGGAVASGSAADPFADFGAPPEEDDMGFQEPAEEDGPGAGLDSFGEEKPAAPAAVRTKAAHQFKASEATQKDKIIDFLSENGAKFGLIGGGVVALLILGFVAALAFLPATFKARPTRADDQPGFLAETSFSFQKMLKSSYYGKAMEDAYITAGKKAMASWSGAGFARAEKEFRELLAFDPGNVAAKSALLKLYSLWDIVEETRAHEKNVASYLGNAADDSDRALAMLAMGKPQEAKEFAQKSNQVAFLEAASAYMAGDVTAGVESLRTVAKSDGTAFLPNLLYAHALRDAKAYPEAVSAFGVASAIVKGHAKAQLELGRLYYGPVADEEKALAAFTAVLDAKTGASEKLKAEALYYLSHIMHRRGNGPQAISNIQNALKIEAANPKYLVMLGDIYFDTGKVVDAFNAYDQAVKADAKFVDGYVGLGRANERLEKQALALENFKQAIAIEPGNMRANFLYASLVLRQGNKAEAEVILTNVLEANPNNIDAIAHLAAFYSEQKRLRDALEQYVRIIELAPNRIEGYVGRGAALIGEGNIAEAQAMFERAASIAPGDPAVLFRLGQAAFLQKDYVKAGTALQATLLKDPYHWEAHLYLGMNHFRTEKYELALKELEKVIDINLRAAEAYHQRALVYYAQSQLDQSKAGPLLEKAAADMQSALYHRKDDAEYYYDQGLIFAAAGLEGKAKEAWLKAKELRPGYQEAMFKLAAYYVSFTDYASAENILQELLKSSPRNAEAFLGMGKVYQAKGDLQQAFRAFSRAAQLNPKSADAENLIGETFDQQGETDKAVKHFHRALKLDPKHGEAHYNLGLYWKDRDKARSTASFKAAINSGTLSKVKHEDAETMLRELEYLK